MAKTKQEIRAAERIKKIQTIIKALNKDIAAQERNISASQRHQAAYESKTNKHLAKIAAKKKQLESKLS